MMNDGDVEGQGPSLSIKDVKNGKAFTPISNDLLGSNEKEKKIHHAVGADQPGGTTLSVKNHMLFKICFLLFLDVLAFCKCIFC